LELLESRRVLSTWIVTNTDDGGPVGNLRDDIAAAQPGDTTVFDPSLDHQTITLGGQQLEINKNLTIQGPGAGLLAISGNNQSRVFQVDAGTNVTISGLTIEGGVGQSDPPEFGFGDGNDNYDGYGGGILNLGTLALSGYTVTGNMTGSSGPQMEGGGIYNDGTMTLSGCTVTKNDALSRGSFPSNYQKGAGGGIFNDTQGNLTILSSVVQNNTASIGADICDLGTMTISKDSNVGHIDHKL
jgi:hypothetical protein